MDLGPFRALRDRPAAEIIEFLVEDVEALVGTLHDELGDELTVAQPPRMMPWGNLSVLIRDPEVSLINLHTPVTPRALALQANRTPKMPAQR